MKKTNLKFYQFRQNNSFGEWKKDKDVDINVLIQAPNADAANLIAEGVGIYFNGCEDGRDCPCCGGQMVSSRGT